MNQFTRAPRRRWARGPRQGRGVLKDGAEAERWLRWAAEHGHIEAQGILGDMYESGKGVPRDPAHGHT